MSAVEGDTTILVKDEFTSHVVSAEPIGHHQRCASWACLRNQLMQLRILIGDRCGALGGRGGEAL